MKNDLSIYDAVADTWWSDQPHWVQTLQNMVPARLAWFERYVQFSGLDVLDLGAAGGFMAEELDARGAQVTGIDPAEGAIAAARRHAEATGRDIRYDVGVGEALPYADAAFDAVVCVDVLEHVNDLSAVLAEVSRVLRPGGWFLFDTINRNPLARFVTITVAENILGLLPKGTHDPAMFIKPDELRDHLTANDLSPGSFAGLGPSWMTLKGEIKFSRLPTTAIIYMGNARKKPL
ncbi:MAG: bifunctional 2-polyprenyl-6-hydroxyphenol methylase/3-demethylubiquinol 3-O-methyltransferase UbiG [Pseudomonadota bacterium]